MRGKVKGARARICGRLHWCAMRVCAIACVKYVTRTHFHSLTEISSSSPPLIMSSSLAFTSDE